MTTEQLGGRHNYDLTFDVTHLIVGEYDTAKYRHVAQERPDIRLMAVGWVEAVRRLWVADADIDFAALEEKWTLKTFETGGGELDEDGNETPRMRLLCCSSGIEGGSLIPSYQRAEGLPSCRPQYRGSVTD